MTTVGNLFLKEVWIQVRKRKIKKTKRQRRSQAKSPKSERKIFTQNEYHLTLINFYALKIILIRNYKSFD